MSVYEQTFHVGDAGSNPAGDASSQKETISSGYENPESAADGCITGDLTPISPQPSQSPRKRGSATSFPAQRKGPRRAEKAAAAARGLKLRREPGTRSLFERFWRFVAVAGAGECWLWIGTLGDAGYGQVAFLGESLPSHIVAFELASGRQRKGFILHSCDTRRCCNPAHLSEGTQAENVDDMMRRDRNADQRGAYNGNAKLSQADVEQIRERYEAGRLHPQRSPLRLTYAQLAKEYRVSIAAVTHIVLGSNWQGAPKNQKVYDRAAKRPRKARFGELTVPAVGEDDVRGEARTYGSRAAQRAAFTEHRQ